MTTPGPSPISRPGPPRSDQRDTERVEEEVMVGGVANAGSVVRRGDFILRPANPHSASIHRFLRALHGTGFEGASVPVAIEDGRERLRFIPGEVALVPYPGWAQSDLTLGS